MKILSRLKSFTKLLRIDSAIKTVLLILAIMTDTKRHIENEKKSIMSTISSISFMSSEILKRNANVS